MKEIILGFLAVQFVLGLGGAVWHSRLRYAIQHQVDYSNVSVENKPHDCEFMHAPIGDKNCSYEPVVFTIRLATNRDGQPIISNDEGHTWWLPTSPMPMPPASVSVSWKKKDH